MEPKCPLCNPVSPGEDIKICKKHQEYLIMKPIIISAMINAAVSVHPLVRALNSI